MKAFATFVTLILFTMVTQAQTLKAVRYQDGRQQLNGLITSNAGIDLPAVLILPAWKGIDNEARQAALSLEKAGYVAFIADIYGAGNIPADKCGGFQNFGTLQERLQSLPTSYCAGVSNLEETKPGQ